MPEHKVTAKPLIGPVPNRNSAKPVIQRRDVRIDDRQQRPCLVPASIATNGLSLPKLFADTLEINTLESTPMPIVEAMPAIPGKVRVAFNAYQKPTR